MAIQVQMSKNALLIDTTLCIGCGACYQACKDRNQLPVTAEDPLEDSLSDKTYTVVKAKGERFYRRMCMHCEVPTCASACPVGALEKTAAGPVIYFQDRCMGCRYCMQACPFSIPKYEWGELLPRVRKCDLCASRLQEDLPTACAEACPTGATLFGNRGELLAEARSRIEQNPEGYVHHIFGSDDIGGTSVLIISDMPFAEMGLPTTLGTEPLPSLTWEVLEKIPTFSTLAAAFLGGIWWITNRRDEVRQAEQEERGGHK